MATSNISIDSSFFDVNLDGVIDQPHEVFFTLANKIGGREIVVDLKYPSPNVAGTNINTSYRASTMISGIPLMYLVEYFRGQTVVSGTINSLIEWTSSPDTLSGTQYVVAEYFNKMNPSFGQQPTYIESVFGDTTVSGFDAVAVGYISSDKQDNAADLLLNYINFSGNYTPGYIPIPVLSGTIDVPSVYTTYANTSSGVLNNIVDITLSGWVPGPMVFDVFSVLDNRRDGTSYSFPLDIVLISGSLNGFLTDLFSTSLNTRDYEFDVYSSALSIPNITTDVITTPGCIHGINYDVWSVVCASGTILCDVEMLSMYFDNFSLGVGEYMPASGTICVDVHDELYTIVTSGTYFMVDGVPVSGTLTPIADGYRICYNPVDDFASLLGPTKFTARAENNQGTVLVRDFYVTFGYIVEYDNFEPGGIDFGFGNKIGVRISASNLLRCPIDDADGFWFVSKNYSNSDLGSSITGIEPTEGKRDLGAKIYPNSTAYFYDKVFRMELTVKDFAGNEMEPFVLVFKVENLNEN